MNKTKEIYNNILTEVHNINIQFRENYLINQMNDIVNKFDKTKDFLNQLLTDKYQQKKIHKTIDFLKNEQQEFKYIVEDLNNPLLLGVTGVGNSGKSSFINSILKQQVAETNMRAETWLFNIFSYKKNANGDGIIYFNGEEPKKVQSLEIEEIISNENKLFDQSKIIVNEKRFEINKENISRKMKEKKSKQVERKYLYQSNVYKLKRYYDIPLLNKFRLADTPGLGQANKSQMNDIREYYQKVDGLVVIIDVDRIDQEATKKSLQKIRENSTVQSKILLILNKADSSKNFQIIKEKAEKNYGSLVDSILPYSAKKINEAHKNNDETSLKEFNYYHALDFLNKIYQKNKKIRIDKKFESINHMLEASKTEVLNIKTSIIEKTQEFNTNIQEMNDYIYSLNHNLLNKINKAFNDYKSDLMNNVQKIILNTDSRIALIKENKRQLKQLNLRLKHIINEGQKKTIKNVYFLSQDSIVSDYDLIKSDQTINKEIFIELEKNILSISKNFEIPTFEKTFMNRTKEFVGEKILDNLSFLDYLRKIGRQLLKSSDRQKQQFIRQQQRDVATVINKKTKMISDQIYEQFNHLNKNIINNLRQGFNDQYINYTQAEVVNQKMDELINALSIEERNLEITEILKYKEII